MGVVWFIYTPDHITWPPTPQDSNLPDRHLHTLYCLLQHSYHQVDQPLEYNASHAEQSIATCEVKWQGQTNTQWQTVKPEQSRPYLRMILFIMCRWQIAKGGMGAKIRLWKLALVYPFCTFIKNCVCENYSCSYSCLSFPFLPPPHTWWTLKVVPVTHFTLQQQSTNRSPLITMTTQTNQLSRHAHINVLRFITTPTHTQVAKLCTHCIAVQLWLRVSYCCVSCSETWSPNVLW